MYVFIYLLNCENVHVSALVSLTNVDDSCPVSVGVSKTLLLKWQNIDCKD